MKKNWNKTGGVVSDLISGTGGLVILVVVILVVVSTLLGSNLLTDSTYNDSAQSMASNFTDGIAEVSGKLPTILLIGAVVLLFGVIVLLVRQSAQMGIGGGGSL